MVTLFLRWLQADLADFRGVWPLGGAWGSVRLQKSVFPIPLGQIYKSRRITRCYLPWSRCEEGGYTFFEVVTKRLQKWRKHALSTTVDVSTEIVTKIATTFARSARATTMIFRFSVDDSSKWEHALLRYELHIIPRHRDD